MTEETKLPEPIKGQTAPYLINVTVLKVLKLDPESQLPVYMEEGAACADIFSNEDVTIPVGKWHAVKTGLSFDIPSGFEVQVRARSGLAFKYGITILNGVGTVDSSYKGEVLAVLINHGTLAYGIKKGDRIAQIKLSPARQCQIQEVTSLSESVRGTGGFGSTGVS